MSAPQQGRNSPEPEDQTKTQIGAVVKSGKMEESSKKDEGKSQDEQTRGLSSNPVHILEKNANDSTSKTVS
jgi:hypothetical protein